MRYFLFALFLCVWQLHFSTHLQPNEKIVVGTIASIPEKKPHVLHFFFDTEYPSMHFWVSWYASPPVTLTVGDTWQLALKYRSNATATVQMNFANQVLSHHPWRYPVNYLRQKINNQLENVLAHHTGLGFISALTIGMRDSISETQWQDLRGTGTNHLMAIAGLHLGFLAAMVYAFIQFVWRRSEWLMLYLPSQEAAALAMLLATFCYSALSGFALPTQRATIMLSIFLLTKLQRRYLRLWSAWWIALDIIILLEPSTVFTASFWLSFGAVALLIYGCSARLAMHQWWWHWMRAQWVIGIGLIPLSLLFFHQVALLGIFANFIAIPFVGFIILPLSLCGFWKLADYLLMHFWPVMHWLATLPHSQWYQSLSTQGCLFSSSIGVILLLAPRGWPNRWLGFIWLLPLLAAKLFTFYY